MRILALLLLTASAADTTGPAHGLAMHGDLKYGPGFTHFDYVNPDAPKGGELRLAGVGTFDSFNPFIIKGNPDDGSARVYDTLMVGSADEPFSEYGLLAETVETPPDRSWVAFTLRKEARWHDGKPVTVDDVIWSFETLRSKGQPFYRAYYSSVVGVEKTGERTVKFTFKPGENRALPLIVGQLPVLPKHYWEGATSRCRRSGRARSRPYKVLWRRSTGPSTSASPTGGARTWR
jgi:microcin C transport system substrate-binding protein